MTVLGAFLIVVMGSVLGFVAWFAWRVGVAYWNARPSAGDWTDAYGNPCPLPADVLKRADEFFDAVEDGTVDLSEAVPVDEFIADYRKRAGGGA